jgi:putative tricarboxylic transport membrane protein
MRLPDRYSSLFWLLVGLVTIAGSLYHGFGSLSKPGPGFLGLIAGALLAILALAVFVSSLNNRGTQEKLEDLWRSTEWSKPLLTVIILLIYGIVFEYVGFLITTTAIMFLLFRMRCPYSNLKMVLLALAATLSSFLLFQTWLDVPLPPGILDSLR